MSHQIINQICEANGITVAALHTRSRVRKIMTARKQAVLACREAGLSVKQTGAYVGVTPLVVAYHSHGRSFTQYRRARAPIPSWATHRSCTKAELPALYADGWRVLWFSGDEVHLCKY